MKKNYVSKLLLSLTATTVIASTQLPFNVISTNALQENIAKAAETGSGTISGQAWLENGAKDQFEGNSFQRGTDLLIMGLSVELKDGNTGVTITTQNTDGQGRYAFTGLPDGKYLVSFHNPLIWSPVIANFTGTNGTNDSDGPTDVRIEILNGQITDGETIDQGFYNGSGAATNDGKAPVLNDVTDITGTVNQPIPAVPVISTDNTLTTVKVDGLPPGMTFTPGTNQTTTPDGQIQVTGEIAGVPSQIGTFPVTVTSTDIYGNQSTDTFNVVVKDIPNTKPALTVNDTTIPYGSSFDPLSIASASDPEGGNVTITVNPSTIDTTKEGPISVTYTATDDKGLTDTKTVTLTVAPKPNTAPTLDVQNTPIPYGSSFDPLSIAKATDAEGDKVTITVNPSTIDTTKTGDVTVTYTATDDRGAKTEKTVVLTVGEKPNDAPVLTVSDVTIDYGTNFDPLSMAKATDVDGDTIKITANPSTIDTTKSGTQVITFTADDGKGGVVTQKGTLTINAKPNTPPELTVNDTTIPYGSTFKIGDYVTTSDADGDTVKLTSDPIDTKKSGSITVPVTADDGNGGVVTKNVTFVVADASVPRIIVNDQYIVQGSTYDPMDNVFAWDAIDQDLTDKVELIKGTVDVNKTGTYDLTYKVTNSAGQSRERTVTITVGMDVEKAVSSLKAITDKLTTEIDGMKVTLQNHEDRINKLEQQVAKNTGDIASIKQQIADQQNQINDINKKIDALNQRIDNQQAQIDALKTQTDKNTADIQALEKDVSGLKEEVKVLQDKVSVLETKVNALEKQVAQNTSDIKSLTDRVTSLESKQKVIEDRLTVLEGKVDQNTKDIAGLKQELSEIKKEIATIKSEIEKIKNDITGLKETDKQMQEQIKVLEDKVSKLESRVDTLEKQVAQNTSDIKSLTDRVTSLESKQKVIEDRLTVLEGKVDQNTKDIAGLKQELSEIKKEIATIKSEIEKIKNDITGLKETDKQLIEKIKELEEKVKVLEGKATNINITINNIINGEKKPSGTTSNTGDNKGTDDSNITKPAQTTENVGSDNKTTDSNSSTGTQPTVTDGTSTSDNIQKPDQSKNSILPDTGNKSLNYLLYAGVPILLIGAVGYTIYRRKLNQQ
ncbi:immunoglobulin-like domain-containing protein [Macrococcus sp. PK]|uniref:immunoglobulin-like domain-containing protein n=1 Tax=Macrococcus sp. PK TaxID=2801919 RepID=UPI001F0F0A7C|nr:immunoglobulin-like domain-containing protein [Macrococcus sp. PK]MCH4986313.1 DUF5011 domain-containing protein [Macrococcus sp. PK]